MMVPQHTPPPEVDEEAIAEHATALAEVARRHFANSLAAGAGVGADIPFRFYMAVRTAVSEELRRTWGDVERDARQIADQAVRDHFAERLGAGGEA